MWHHIHEDPNGLDGWKTNGNPKKVGYHLKVRCDFSHFFFDSGKVLGNQIDHFGFFWLKMKFYLSGRYHLWGKLGFLFLSNI